MHLIIVTTTQPAAIRTARSRVNATLVTPEMELIAPFSRGFCKFQPAKNKIHLKISWTSICEGDSISSRWSYSNSKHMREKTFQPGPTPTIFA